MEEEAAARGLFEPEQDGHDDDDDRPTESERPWLSEDHVGDDAAAAKEEKKPVKRIVRKPRVKLDAQRLLSERGLPALLKYFEKLNFKRKGHEAEDLHTLLWTLQHWAHRLCPHMAFGDFIEKLEMLGSKREIQTCMHKIRLDIPVFTSDFVTAHIDDEPVNEERDLNAPLGMDHSLWSPVPAEFPAEDPEQLSSDILARLEEKRKQALERRRSRMQASQEISAGSSQPESYPDTATQMLAQPEVEATDHLCDGNELRETSAGQDVIMEIL